MKITLFIDSLNSGGAQRQILYLASLLKKNENNVEIVIYHEKIFYKKELEQINVDIHCIKSKKKYLRPYFLYQHLKNNKSEVLISFLDSPNIIASLLRLFRINVKLFVSERNTNNSVKLKDHLKYNLYRLVDGVIANSETQKRFISNNFSFLSENLHVITNCVDLNYFYPLKGEKTCELKIIGAGRIVPQKNIKTLLYGLSLFKKRNDDINFKVEWYGDNFFVDGHPSKASNYYLECLEIIKREDLEDEFKFMSVSKDLRRDYWRNNLLCLPSIHEGYPNVVCEAMACGLPIIASHVSDIPFIVEDGKNGFLFDPHSVDELVASLEKWVNLDADTKQQFSFRSRAIAKDKFSKDKFINSYLSIIDS